MENIASTKTVDWSLSRVIDRLQTNEQVEGVLSIGSLVEHTFTPTSDYDLVIVLRESAQAWYVGVTQIENRFTDLIFVAESALDRVLTLNAPVAQEHELAPIIRWLKQGSVLFDRAQRVQRGQAKVREAEWVQPMTDDDAYGSWFAINYNLAQARRMVRSDDPLYQTTVAIRLVVYGHIDVWFGYFTLRKLAWQGDKEAVKYLIKHDPAFLDLYQQFIKETVLERKLSLYEKTAAIAAAPLGGLWPEQATVMNVGSTLKTWQMLLEDI